MYICSMIHMYIYIYINVSVYIYTHIGPWPRGRRRSGAPSGAGSRTVGGNMQEFVCIYVTIVYTCVCIYIYIHTHMYVYIYICIMYVYTVHGLVQVLLHLQWRWSADCMNCKRGDTMSTSPERRSAAIAASCLSHFASTP